MKRHSLKEINFHQLNALDFTNEYTKLFILKLNLSRSVKNLTNKQKHIFFLKTKEEIINKGITKYSLSFLKWIEKEHLEVKKRL